MDEKERPSDETRLALVEQAIGSIREDIGEMKRTMETFLAKLEANYVPRSEYDALARRIDQLETRVWGLVAGLLVSALGWLVLFVRGAK